MKLNKFFLAFVLLFGAMLGFGALAQEQAQSEAPASVSAPAAVEASPVQEDDQFVPIDDVVSATVAVVKDGKSIGKLGLAVAILNIIILLLKTQLLGSFFKNQKPGLKRLLLLVLGQAMGILISVEGGLSPLSAIVAGLITSGGAIAIYEALSPFLKKKA